ncbi:MAG TPA: hypothetical protein VGG06_21230 [Thermoanaerobaculia bacterium]|jgi:hypothetical protein
MNEQRKVRSLLVTSVLVAVLGCGLVSAQTFTTDFRIEDCHFSDHGGNPYFSLEPGDRLVLEGEEDGEEILLVITVTNQEREVTFETEDGVELEVETRVIEERESIDGELFEVSRNFYARCRETNDVYYFGEEVDFYEDGEIVGHEGAWLAGVDDALPGIIMPGTFLLGSRYYQEIAPEVALDRAENVEMGLTVEVPAGTFEDCVAVIETTGLDPDEEGFKIYCPEIGLVNDNDAIELVEYGDDDDDDDDDDD